VAQAQGGWMEAVAMTRIYVYIFRGVRRPSKLRPEAPGIDVAPRAKRTTWSML
jgi:hypothetical protein